jgi:acrylyl-CoA reductase (NADPH)
VVDCKSNSFKVGDKVLVNGFGLSETSWGGYTQYQSLPEKFVTKRPDGFSAEQAMQIGTAGYTAALCVLALLEHGLEAGKDEILVTGATGGVSSVAIALLSKLGFGVIGVTGRPEHADFIKSLGATEVISRDEMDTGGRALAKERWSGSIDVVGGDTLAQLIAQTKYNGIVTCCGMAGGGDLPATVYPFILRGVTLRGVDSVMVDQERRSQAWAILDQHLDRNLLAQLSETFEFDELAAKAEGLINRKITGRVAIRIPH